MFSVAPSLATNASTAFNPYLGPVSPGLVPAEILPTGPMLVAGNPGVPVPAAAAAAAQKLMRTDRLEVGNNLAPSYGCFDQPGMAHWFCKCNPTWDILWKKVLFRGKPLPISSIIM